jgi:hypothetical protein
MARGIEKLKIFSMVITVMRSTVGWANWLAKPGRFDILGL